VKQVVRGPKVHNQAIEVGTIHWLQSPGKCATMMVVAGYGAQERDLPAAIGLHKRAKPPTLGPCRM
jgi:hypothetical protein